MYYQGAQDSGSGLNVKLLVLVMLTLVAFGHVLSTYTANSPNLPAAPQERSVEASSVQAVSALQSRCAMRREIQSRLLEQPFRVRVAQDHEQFNILLSNLPSFVNKDSMKVDVVKRPDSNSEILVIRSLGGSEVFMRHFEFGAAHIDATKVKAQFTSERELKITVPKSRIEYRSVNIE
ncbi:GAM1 [Acrasis kona]|uniref:GAM1 n=1 Tax=Acrasis kona TaxID=1008807 RepID=A0AAW2YGR6_9EUKA